jgi:hypothetical protein
MLLNPESRILNPGVTGCLLLSAMCVLGFHARGRAQETVPTRVDVYWQQSTVLRKCYEIRLPQRIVLIYPGVDG